MIEYGYFKQEYEIPPEFNSEQGAFYTSCIDGVLKITFEESNDIIFNYKQ